MVSIIQGNPEAVSWCSSPREDGLELTTPVEDICLMVINSDVTLYGNIQLNNLSNCGDGLRAPSTKLVLETN
jgi:hypothetical protein